MPPVREIEQQLSGINNWLLVSGKKTILKGLEKAMVSGEMIVDLLDGLFSGKKITGGGMGSGGVLCITSKRLLFVTGDKSKIAFEEIPYGDIKSLEHEKSFSSVRLNISTRDGSVSFKTFANEIAVKKFAEKIREIEGGGLSYREKNSSSILDAITDIFVDRTSGPEFLESIKKEAPEIEGKDSLIDEMSNLNFLYSEAKNISRAILDLEPYKEDEEFRKKVINDLIILSSLAGMADGKMTEEELLFITSAVMPLNPAGSAETGKLAKTIFGFDSFPIHYRDSLIDYWGEISDYMKTRKRPGGGIVPDLAGPRAPLRRRRGSRNVRPAR